MSRNYATFATSIWLPEDDFTHLSRDAQWAYFMLSTQKDISAAGVLSLNVKRWASRARDTSRADIVAALQELSAAGKVVYDTETEELLVVTFVDDDNGYGNRKRRPVIERAARAIESLAVRRALGREFVRLGLPVEWVRLAEADLADPKATPGRAFSHVDSLSGGLSATASGRASGRASDGTSRFDGVVVTEVEVVTTSTLNPQPVPPPAAPAGTAAADEALFVPPSQPDPEPDPNEARNRAFGIARWWIELRRNQKTPVAAGGKNGPLHPVRSLVEQFTPYYSDDEIKAALSATDTGLPAKQALERALVQVRRQQQGRQTGGGSGHSGMNGIAVRDVKPQPENANSRNARGWLTLDVTAGGDYL